jgi:hypothetical protein
VQGPPVQKAGSMNARLIFNRAVLVYVFMHVCLFQNVRGDNQHLWCRGNRACLSSWETWVQPWSQTSTHGLKIPLHYISKLTVRLSRILG